MVLRKRLDYRSGGHQVPATPRVPTLASGKRSTRRKKNEMCALDLLATTAGTLLEDQENSSSRPNMNGTAASYATMRKSVEAEQFDEVLPFNSVAVEKDGCKGCTVGCAGVCGLLRQTNICLAENSSTQNVVDSVLESVTAKLDVLVKDSLVSCTKSCRLGHGLGTIPEYGTIGVCRPWPKRSAEVKQVRRARPTIIRSQVDGNKLNFCGKKISTTRRRVQRTMFKRKRLVQRCFAKSSDEGILTETSGTSFCMGGQNPPCASEGYHVKLAIKSLNIPELLIEIPENATVDSLKRTVTDAVATIIEGGLRVGVLLQGKNIQDDNKTLLQAGICHGGKLDNIGFTLECETGKDSHPGVKAPEEMDFVGADVVEPLATMKCKEPFPETRVGNDNQQPMQDFPNCTLSDPGDCPVEWTAQETSASSQAIVPAATPDVDALAIVSLSRSKRLDFGQRRTRRPFSVAEVEALVEAVEQLGTGRWKDVKFHGFGIADHRTYIDMKDKWKTLVHTASISPQQRRGKAIPQELLDRVLAAQAYWSQQLAKLQANPPFPEIFPA